MSTLIRVWLSTRLGILLASNIALVWGQNSSGRYDVLYGSQGQDACTLQNNIVTSEKCSDSSLSPSLNLPVPSQCTCNQIFFNIWSACSYSTGNNTLPIFTQWTQSCMTSSIDVESSTGFSEVRGNLGIKVPSWAKLVVPGNTTFDMQRAVTVANSTSSSKSIRWTTLQIIVPIAAAVGTLLISGAVLLIYQRSQRKFSRLSMTWPKSLRSRVVSTIDKDESWEIDGPITKQPFQDVHGQHVSVQKSPLDRELTDANKSDNNPKTVPIANSAAGKPPIETHSYRIPIRLPTRLPWKRRPPLIRFVPASPRFRVDEAKSIFTSSGEAVERDEFNAQELVGDLDHVLPGDEETTSLITTNERTTLDSQDVILISRGGRQFTLESGSENTVSVNSHVKIVSPSVRSESHSTMQPVPAKPTLYVPPPPVSYAAPTPPVIPRSLRPTELAGGSNGEHSLAYFQPPSFLSPIMEASPTQPSSSSNVSLNRSSAMRRASSPGSITSLENSNANISPLSYHWTASPDSDHESEEDDIYTEVTATNGHDHSPFDSNSSNPSFYYNPPDQGPLPLHPVRPISTDDPAAFFPGAVRGAGYLRDYF